MSHLPRNSKNYENGLSGGRPRKIGFSGGRPRKIGEGFHSLPKYNLYQLSYPHEGGTI